MPRPNPQHWSRHLRNVPPAPTDIRRTCTGCRLPKVLLGGRKTPSGWKCAHCLLEVVSG